MPSEYHRSNYNDAGVRHETGAIETFTGDGDFEAMRKAEAYIRDKGWTVGPNQRGAPRGVMFSDEYAIAKWRNLGPEHRRQLDAVLIGSGRYGPLTLTTKVPS